MSPAGDGYCLLTGSRAPRRKLLGMSVGVSRLGLTEEDALSLAVVSFHELGPRLTKKK